MCGRGGKFGLLERETGKVGVVERMEKKGGAGVWDGEEGCCWWRAQEGARVNQERGRIERAWDSGNCREERTETVGWTWL